MERIDPFITGEDLKENIADVPKKKEKELTKLRGFMPIVDGPPNPKKKARKLAFKMKHHYGRKHGRQART